MYPTTTPAYRCSFCTPDTKHPCTVKRSQMTVDQHTAWATGPGFQAKLPPLACTTYGVVRTHTVFTYPQRCEQHWQRATYHGLHAEA